MPKSKCTNKINTLQVIDLQCIRNDRELFSGLSFDVQPGQVLQIAGPNGCGKTSLLRMLCGLLPYRQGEITWQGKPIAQNWSDYQANMLHIGHNPGVKANLSCYENLQYCSALHPVKAERSINKVLRQVGLLGYEQTLARNLSAGQLRRVALARLLLLEAKLWILDEPFTAIDKQGVKEIEQILLKHVQEKGMIILTTHQPLNIDHVQLRQVELAAA